MKRIGWASAVVVLGLAAVLSNAAETRKFLTFNDVALADEKGRKEMEGLPFLDRGSVNEIRPGKNHTMIIECILMGGPVKTPKGEIYCRAWFEVPNDEGIRIRMGNHYRLSGTIQSITTDGAFHIEVSLKDVVYDDDY